MIPGDAGEAPSTFIFAESTKTATTFIPFKFYDNFVPSLIAAIGGSFSGGGYPAPIGPVRN